MCESARVRACYICCYPLYSIPHAALPRDATALLPVLLLLPRVLPQFKHLVLLLYLRYWEKSAERDFHEVGGATTAVGFMFSFWPLQCVFSVPACRPAATVAGPPSSPYCCSLSALPCGSAPLSIVHTHDTALRKMSIDGVTCDRVRSDACWPSRGQMNTLCCGWHAHTPDRYVL